MCTYNAISSHTDHFEILLRMTRLFALLGLFCGLSHYGETAIENVNTIDDNRSKTVRNRVFDYHLSPVGVLSSLAIIVLKITGLFALFRLLCGAVSHRIDGNQKR